MRLLLLWICCYCMSVAVAESSTEFAMGRDMDEKIESVANPPEEAPEEEEESSTGNDTNMRCRWGEKCPPPEDTGEEEQVSPNPSSNNSPGSNTIPFVPPKSHPPLEEDALPLAPQHKPPEGFVLSARVYTDPDDHGRAHFDQTTQITLPYWECGAVGATTHAIQVKNAYFRHSLGTTLADIWSGTEYGPHPHLLIPLVGLELTLSSGESRVFGAGDVILLEDVLASGHKMRAAVEGESLDALIVTLPQHYHFVGKDRVSLGGNTRRETPCPNNVFGISEKATLKSKRQIAFGAFGAVVSSATALFLTKVAPLWLSVGIGGTCFVVGGTGAAVICGEAFVEQIQTVMERRRLETNTNVAEEEEEEEYDDESNPID